MPHMHRYPMNIHWMNEWMRGMGGEGELVECPDGQVF